MDKDYKYKFILLKTEADRPKDILKDALNEYIKKLQKDIELYAKNNNGADNRIKVSAERMMQAMDWRDKMDMLGSNTIYAARDIDEYKSGLSRIY